MPLVEDDHVVETFTSNEAEHPFDQWILPRGARYGKDLLHLEAVDASVEVRSVVLACREVPLCLARRAGSTRALGALSTRNAQFRYPVNYDLYVQVVLSDLAIG